MFERSLGALAIGTLIVLGAQAQSRAFGAEAEDEIRTVFERFVTAQNAHNLEAVGEISSDSEDFLWITRGTPVWGREAALERFEALYAGTWKLEPRMDEFRILELGDESAQLFVPVTFMIAPAGQTAEPSNFLMNQTLIKTAEGWEVLSILPILIPQSEWIHWLWRRIEAARGVGVKDPPEDGSGDARVSINGGPQSSQHYALKSASG